MAMASTRPAQRVGSLFCFAVNGDAITTFEDVKYNGFFAFCLEQSLFFFFLITRQKKAPDSKLPRAFVLFFI
jgi:hypothetical protein